MYITKNPNKNSMVCSVPRLIEVLVTSSFTSRTVETVTENRNQASHVNLENLKLSLKQGNNQNLSSNLENREKTGIIRRFTPYIAGPVGFEPTTNSLGGCRAILAALRTLFLALCDLSWPVKFKF